MKLVETHRGAMSGDIRKNMSFLKQLEERANHIDSLLCVGLDPHPELLAEHSAAGLYQFCRRLIEATADIACAFKPNSAFFEAFGSDGYEVLKRVIASIPPEIPVILDAKRGDIASTSESYAHSAFDAELLNATAITINPYLGYDAIEPFLKRPEKGVFVLCKTSNPGADEFQTLRLRDDWFLYEMVAAHAAKWNTNDNLGLVVGATDLDALKRVRLVAPKLWLLLPGVGAQGGELKSALHAGLRPDGLGVLVTVSRSLAQADDPRAEAIRLRDTINIMRRQAHQDAMQWHTANIAGELAEAGCVRFGKFTLKSGQESPIYIDLRRLASYPKALQGVARALNQILSRLKFDHIAAIPYAALPIGTAASLLSGRSLIYPLRETKDYGTKATIEGVYKPGDTVVVLDDLATTGGTKLQIIERLQSAGLIVKDIVVVIDREQGAARMLQAAGYDFHSVATLGQLLDIWETQGTLSSEQRREVDAYLASQSAEPG